MSADTYHAHSLEAKHRKTRLCPTVFILFRVLVRNAPVWPEEPDNSSAKGTIQRRKPRYTSAVTLNSLRL